MRHLKSLLFLAHGAKMRKAAFNLVLALGLVAVAHGSIIPCPTAPVQTYVTTFSTFANGCTIGSSNLVFFNFQYSTTVTGPAAVPNSTQATLSPLNDGNGFGLQYLPTVPFFANATGVADADLKFIVQSFSGPLASPTLNGNIISDLYLEMSGTATAGTFGTPGQDVLVETFCPGGSTLPPAAVCPASTPPVTQSRILTINPGTSSPQALRITNFAFTNSIAIDKDIQASGNNGSATITGVKNQISTIPEPATSFFVGTGLFLVWAAARRRLKR